MFAFEPPHDKTNKMACGPSEDSDQPGHPPSLFRVFAVHMKKAWVLSYPLSTQWRLWSDWADAQADLRLCWAHSHFVGFVMQWLILVIGVSSDAVFWWFQLVIHSSGFLNNYHDNLEIGSGDDEIFSGSGDGQGPDMSEVYMDDEDLSIKEPPLQVGFACEVTLPRPVCRCSIP